MAAEQAVQCVPISAGPPPGLLRTLAKLSKVTIRGKSAGVLCNVVGIKKGFFIREFRRIWRLGGVADFENGFIRRIEIAGG